MAYAPTQAGSSTQAAAPPADQLVPLFNDVFPKGPDLEGLTDIRLWHLFCYARRLEFLGRHLCNTDSPEWYPAVNEYRDEF